MALDNAGPRASSDPTTGIVIDALAKFALAPLPFGATIDRATVQITVFATSGAGTAGGFLPFDVSGFGAGAGPIALGDFRTPTANLGWVTTSASVLPITYSVEVTALVRLLTSTGSASLAVQFDTATTSTLATFDRPGGGLDSPYRPTLAVTYTPRNAAVLEPASAALVVAGLGLAAMTRRRLSGRS